MLLIVHGLFVSIKKAFKYQQKTSLKIIIFGIRAAASGQAERHVRVLRDGREGGGLPLQQFRDPDEAPAR